MNRSIHLGRAVWLLPPLLFLAWLVGQVFRDRCWITGLCFYLPSPLVAAALVAAVAVASRRARRIAVGVLLLSLAPVFWVGVVENQWRQPTAPAQGDFRLVHWNVFNGTLGWSGVRANLRAADADFYLLSEVPSAEPLENFLAELGPEFQGKRLASMAVLARGEIHAERVVTPSGRVTAFHVHWSCRGQTLSVLAVDLPSSPAIARDPLLREVRAIMESIQPDIVVGDFNAPRRSAVLADLPAGYVHAYTVSGLGWSYTWPAPVPLWAIDQCIIGPRIAATDYQLRTTNVSDHRLQLLQFRSREE